MREWYVGRTLVDKGLEEVLVGVLENALDESVDSQTVELTAVEREGRLLVTVVDDGKGMNVEELERCPELGFTTKAQRGGTGVGIPLARAVLRSVGGSMKIMSRPGEGTRIEIELPFADGE